jgi:exosortase/archaeosortase family protein
MMKVLAFPIFYLALAFKVSDRYWDLLADKLRLIVAHAAEVVLGMLSLNVDLAGSRITIFPAHGQPIPLDVVDACSGLRSLMAYVALGAAVAWLSPRPTWQKWTMLALTVPVAVLVNIGRLTVLGLLSLRWPSLAEGQAHIFIGMLMLIPALLLLLLVGWVLDHVLIRDSAARPAAPAQVPAPAAPDTVVLRRWLAGGAGGLILAGLLGLCYLLAMTVLRPQDMFQGRLSPGWARGLLAAAAVLAVPAILLARRTFRTDSARGLAGRSGALGLATGILLTCVLGIHIVVAANNWVLFKLPVPLRHEFVQIPANLGPWHRTHDFPFSPEERDLLGPWAVNWLYERTDGTDSPPAGLHLTYYTGIVDTVPHVPERCELAGGATEMDRTLVTLRLGGPGYHPRPQDPAATMYAPSKLAGGSIPVPQTAIQATVSQFVSKENQHYCVIYFFVANGGYFANPDQVRAKGFDPRDRYNYYCKVQMKLLTGGDTAAATAQASEFLSAVMPEDLACLPDWDQVGRGPGPGNQP